MIHSLPPALRSALSDATSAVDFDRLTDDFVLSDACRRLQYRYGVLTDPKFPAAGPQESFLSETEYHQGCRRWLEALKLYHPSEYPAWKQLYESFWFGSDIPSRSFEERREYDIQLRSAARPVGTGKPGPSYANLWLAAERKVAKRNTDAMNSKASALESELADVRRWASSLAATSQAAANAVASSSTAHPAENNSSKRSSAGQSFRERKEKSIFCFVCGSNYHAGYKCDATKKAASTKTESVSATRGTYLEDADFENAAEVSMFAPSADPAAMALPLARPRPPWGVTTPLRLDRWRFHLGKFDLTREYADVLHGIEFGFSYKSTLTISETRIYPNMRSASEFPEVIDKKIQKELEAGRYKGPYTKSELESLIGPFIAHPLGVVKKDESSKPRLVEDLSFPHNGDSINSLTDVSDLTLDWGGLAETISVMVSAPEGTQAASLDIEGAYRTIGITPSEFWLGIVQDNYEKFLVDLAAKFGGKSCGFNFEGPAKGFCVLCILIFTNLILIRWVDDVMPIRTPINSSPPFIYSVELEDICNLGRDLGFSFAKEKLVDFGPVAKYLGFLWCWDTREVLVPDVKRTKYLDAVMLAQSKDSISLESLRSLCGKLSHVAMIILEGRVNLRALWQMLTNMEKKKIHEKVSWKLMDSQLRNLAWWEEKLGETRIGLQLCTMVMPDDSFGLYCDASTSFGIGIVIEGKAESFKFKPDWKTAGGVSRDIGYAEFAALHFLLFFFFSSHKIRNHHLKVHSDNTGVVGAWKSRSSRNPEQNEILGQILRILISRQCFMTLEYVRSADNPADPPSRGIFTENAKKTSFRGFPAGYSDIVSRIK